MTVANESSRKTFTGDGATTSFGTSPVVFFETSNLVVSVVTTATGAATTLTEDTHYTVSGGDGSTGTVDLSGGSAPYGAPSAAQTLVIVRDLPLTQSADPDNGDNSDAEVIEEAADRLTMMAQQLQRQIDGAFRLADTDVSGADATIPTPVASRVIGWNDSADALQNYAAADLDLALVSTFMETVLDDATAADARATLGSGVVGDAVFTAATPAAARAVMVAAGLASANVFAGTQTWNDGGNIASAGALTLGSGNTFVITGTTTINSINTKGVGTIVILFFNGVMTLTHHATDLVLLTAADITTAVGDSAIFEEYATGDWRMVSYSRANGTALRAPYDSGNLIITSGGPINLAHELPAQPRLVVPFLKCLTPQYNYAAGDEFQVIGYQDNIGSGAAGVGVSLVPNATHIAVRFGSNTQAFYVLDKTSGAQAAITNANWALIVRAWL